MSAVASGMSHIAPPYTPGYEVVTFVWSTDKGHCYECGLPAAFYLPDAYGDQGEEPNDTNKRCAVCAANAATDGERVKRIPNITASAVCKHCQHGIVQLDHSVDWIAPDAGNDREGGDGIWRETCPDNHESREAPHEPEI